MTTPNDKLCQLSEPWSDKGLDPSGSIRETQERLEALCAKQGHLTATTIDTSIKGTRGIDIVCQRCGRVEQRTLTVVR